MKFNILGYDISLRLLYSVKKRITVAIPDNADDTWLRRDRRGVLKIQYFKNGTPFYIDIPKCKDAHVVSVSKLYNKDRTGYAKNRKIVIDLIM